MGNTQSAPAGTVPSTDITGVWRSHYGYTSSSRKGEFESEHYVRIFRKGRFIILESVPGENSSYLLMRLSLDDSGGVLTGSWQEETDPNGYYKGATYHGAIQLILSADHRQMRGKWVGFGKNMEVNVGPWDLAYVGRTVPADAR